MTKSIKKTVAYLIFRTRENTGSKVVFNQAIALMKKGYSVKIFTLFGKNASWFPKDISVIPIYKYFFSYRPTILIATFWPTAYIMLLLPARKKFYFVMGWEEEFYSNLILRALARWTYKLPFSKITLSNYLKKRLKDYAQNDHAIYKINTYFIDPSIFNSRKGTIKKRSKTIQILSVISWYNRYKGPDLLVLAIKKLKENHPEYQFTLIGREEKSYSPLIDRYYSNPSSRKIAKLYQDADLLLVTSRVEGFYIPGVEAMACGCPVITTNSGGILEYAKNNVNAIVLKKLDDLWVKDIIDNFFKNSHLKKKLIKNGYKEAHKYQSYSWNKAVNDLEKIFFT